MFIFFSVFSGTAGLHELYDTYAQLTVCRWREHEVLHWINRITHELAEDFCRDARVRVIKYCFFNFKRFFLLQLQLHKKKSFKVKHYLLRSSFFVLKNKNNMFFLFFKAEAKNYVKIRYGMLLVWPPENLRHISVLAGMAKAVLDGVSISLLWQGVYLVLV